MVTVFYISACSDNGYCIKCNWSLFLMSSLTIFVCLLSIPCFIICQANIIQDLLHSLFKWVFNRLWHFVPLVHCRVQKLFLTLGLIFFANFNVSLLHWIPLACSMFVILLSHDNISKYPIFCDLCISRIFCYIPCAAGMFQLECTWLIHNFLICNNADSTKDILTDVWVTGQYAVCNIYGVLFQYICVHVLNVKCAYLHVL